MFNVLLDELPEEWNGYPIDSDFQIGIQISQCLEDPAMNEREKIVTAADLLFVDSEKYPKSITEAAEGISWFLNECNHDRHPDTKKIRKKYLDFDIDQWRIYAAFRHQYGIDLNSERMHWFVFMGLLSNLDDCAFTRVIEYRQKEIKASMSKEEKKTIIEVKKIYDLQTEAEEETEETKEMERNAVMKFNKLRNQKI